MTDRQNEHVAELGSAWNSRFGTLSMYVKCTSTLASNFSYDFTEAIASTFF